MAKLVGKMDFHSLKKRLANIDLEDIDEMAINQSEEMDERVIYDLVSYRDHPIAIINGEVYIGGRDDSHSDVITKFEKDNNLGDEDIYSLVLGHEINNNAIIEGYSYKNITSDEAVKLLREKFNKVYDASRCVLTRLAKRR